MLFALAHNPSVLPGLSEEPFKNMSPITTMLIIPIREAPRLSGMAQRTREGVIACVFRVRLLWPPLVLKDRLPAERRKRGGGEECRPGQNLVSFSLRQGKWFPSELAVHSLNNTACVLPTRRCCTQTHSLRSPAKHKTHTPWVHSVYSRQTHFYENIM